MRANSYHCVGLLACAFISTAATARDLAGPEIDLSSFAEIHITQAELNQSQNLGYIAQNGNTNLGAAIQSGSGNQAYIVQAGSNATALITQTGSGNYAYIRQR